MAVKHQRSKKPNVDEHKHHFPRTANKKILDDSEPNLDAHADDATGFGGDDKVNTSEAVLTTETGTASQTERYIMSANYAAVSAPELTSEGLYECRECGKGFGSFEEYRRHYQAEHSIVRPLPH
jgi:hypothetical protein